jgi:PAS domain S-box-containing protein
MERLKKMNDQLLREVEILKEQLSEANDTIEAIRNGQVDAFIVNDGNSHEVFTLRSADKTYRVFIEKMTEGAVTVSAQGIILYSNFQFASMVGLNLSTIIGCSFFECIEEEYVPLFSHRLKQFDGEDGKMEIVLKGPNRGIPVLLSFAKLELEEELSLSMIITDLTMQKEAQLELEKHNDALEEINKALEDSNHDLQQFASIASHDLQEPLRKIQMFSNILCEKLSGTLEPEDRAFLNKIERSARRMKTLIVDVLNYSKLSSNSNLFTEIDMNILLRECVEDFELIIAEKNAQLTIGKLPVLEANHGQMRQLFQNLISNALKFASEERIPVIEIYAQLIDSKSFDANPAEDGRFCHISFRDNGIGFESKYVESIFGLFQRLHSKDAYEGTGIGLAITKKIVEKHNGLIRAVGAEGQGAIFSIILPLNQK